MSETIKTPLTEMFGIKYPVILAGMNAVAGAELAAAVTNAGGLGVVGGVTYTPKMLRDVVAELKECLHDKNAPFGIDLLLPQVGGNARKTNKDYTGGKLPELIDIVIESGAALFVSAVGVPPKWAVDKLHAAGIPVMNMIGAVKHATKALDVGVDIICAQGHEGGGHTGDIGTSVLIPQVVDLCKGKKNTLNGGPVHVIAAGGIFDGRGLAMSLSLGASAVWVGTRFICSEEACCPPRHQKAVIEATSADTYRTLIYTGRPLRIIKNAYASEWENNRQQDIKRLTTQGILPYEHLETSLEVLKASGLAEGMDEGDISVEATIQARPLLSGQAAGAVKEIKPAKAIVEEMVKDAIEILRVNTHKIAKL